MKHLSILLSIYISVIISGCGGCSSSGRREIRQYTDKPLNSDKIKPSYEKPGKIKGSPPS